MNNKDIAIIAVRAASNERITYLADCISAKFSHETTDDTEEG